MGNKIIEPNIWSIQLINKTNLLPRQRTQTTDTITLPGKLIQNDNAITVINWMQSISEERLFIRERYTAHKCKYYKNNTSRLT